LRASRLRTCVDGKCSYPFDDKTCAKVCAEGVCVGGGTCEGVTCATPPAARCEGNQLRVHEAPGRCDGGTCLYSSKLISCTQGCQNNACVGDPCAGVSCSAAPTSVCKDASTLRAFSAPGLCAAGSCTYPAQEITCQHGCEAGKCKNDPCAGVTCMTPPATFCKDASTLKSFTSPGSCAGGSCTYAPKENTCPFGCEAGQCKNDPCAGVSCTTPPAAHCKDASTLRSFTSPGSCAGGSCTYASKENTCQYGCEAGQCKNDPCAGVSCTTPPAKHCKDASTLRSFASTGTCSGGSCSYAPTDSYCPAGCDAATASCKADLCAGVSCTTPPANSCVDASTARIYGVPGSCSGGSCSYSYSDQLCPNGCAGGSCQAPVCGSASCNQPPPAVCKSAQELEESAPLGTCVSNACSYQKIITHCSEGCLNGACLAGSWTLEKITGAASSLSFPQLAVDASGKLHVVGCKNGTSVVYYRRGLFGWTEEVVDPSLGTGCMAALALDAQGQPLIAYYDSTNSDLRFARRQGSGFQKSVVVNAGNVGQGPSIVLGKNGQPILAYWDATANQIKVALGQSNGTWSFESVGAGSASWKWLVSQLRYDASGDLHLVMGASGSYAEARGYYDQPPAFHAVRSAAGWSVSKLSDDGLVNRRGIGLGKAGLLLLYSEVAKLGYSDGIYLKTGAAQPELVQQVSNLIYGRPMGLFAEIAGPSYVMNDGVRYRRDALGFWNTDPVPSTFATLLKYAYPADVFDDDGKRTRMLLQLGSSYGTWGVLTQPACQPACSGKSCGDDRCGGSCGSCATGFCSPVGTCTGWQYETVPNPGGSISTSLALESEPGATLHLLAGKSYLKRTSSWSAPTPLAVTDLSDQALALDGSTPHVADLTSGAVGVVVGPTWNETSVATGKLGAPVLAVAGGVWHLATSEASTHVLQHLVRQGGSTTTATVFTPTTTYVLRSTLALDGAGKAHLAWIDGTGTSGTLRYATNAGGSWSTATSVKAGLGYSSAASAPELRIDGAGKLHLLYYDTTSGGGTYYASLQSGSWVTEKLPVLGAYPRLVLDGGTPVAVGAENEAVKLCRRGGGGAWTTSLVPDGGYLFRVAAARDGAGKLHLVYWIGKGGATLLRHAFGQD
jgi:hypothetical protein